MRRGIDMPLLELLRLCASEYELAEWHAERSWGAIDRLNELVRWGRIKPSKADALAGFPVRHGEGHKLSTWHADGLRCASSES